MQVAIRADELQLAAVLDEQALVRAEGDAAGKVDRDALVVVRDAVDDAARAPPDPAHKVGLPLAVDAAVHVAEGAALGRAVEPALPIDRHHDGAALVQAGVEGPAAVRGLVHVRPVARVVDDEMVGVVGIHRHRLARLVELKLPVGRRLVEDGRDVHHAVRMVGPDAPADDRIRQRLAIPIVRHAHDVRPPGRVPRRRADEVPGLVDERGALHQRGVAEATVRSNQNEGLAADRAVHEAVRDAPRLRRHDMGPALGAVDRLEDARGGADQDVVTRVVDHEEAIDPGVEQADVHLGPVLATVRRLEHPAGGRVVVPAHVDEVG
eukprot:3059597-Prymnesium_polylepis.1